MKTYNCPYCNVKLIRDKLIKHIEKEHDDEIPLHYTAYRLVYDIVNNKHGHGECTVCHHNTKWNEKRQKYERLCDNPKCYQEVRKTYESRMMRVYNKTTLLDDPNFQEQMLSHRRISGKYRWSDGTEFEYVGSYEKKFLEFLDKTLEYKSNEIVSPGPILEYDFNGTKKHWITDFLLIPYNLIVEVKEGGEHWNTNAAMATTRAKTFAKEKMITNLGTYNYIRLTQNDFGQLLGILAELKMQVNDGNKDPIYRIHESLYQGNRNEYIDNRLEIAYNVTETAKELIYEKYNNFPLNIIESGLIVSDHPNEDIELIECLYIEPKNKNKQGENQFKIFSEEFYNNLKQLFPLLEDELCEYNNENGIIFGLRM